MLTDNTLRTYTVSEEIYKLAYDFGYKTYAEIIHVEPEYIIQCTASDYAILKELTKQEN